MEKIRTTQVSYSQFLGLLYHDIFNFPLMGEELSFWQVGHQVFPKKMVATDGKHFFLLGKPENVFKRVANRKFLPKKWQIAQKAANLLKFIPTVRFVGLTGTLAMGVAREDADIDLLLVTQKNSLWSTRLATFLLFKLFGLPLRRRGDKDVKNKLCLNLWLDEANLDFSQSPDIYTAHEILQIKPLLDRGGYQKLLLKNNWVWQFFPKAQLKTKTAVTSWFWRVFSLPLVLANRLTFRLQLLYMGGKITKEKISLGQALFHPLDWREAVSTAFAARVEKLARHKNTTPRFLPAD